MRKGVGSVLPSAQSTTAVEEGSVWSAWTAAAPESSAFATARGALAALLTARGIRRLWLPAYCCDTLADGARAAGVELAWYGVDERLDAITTDLDAGLAEGDAAMAIAYFGRAPDAGLRTLALGRPDVLWIEDRAQALDPGMASLGAVTLYSPRKLLGVADGGILAGAALPVARAQGVDQEDLWRPNDLRRADPDGFAPDIWFAAFRAREAAFDPAPTPCSARTLETLKAIPIGQEADARRRNWRALAEPLAGLALWNDATPAFAPLAFPIVVEDAEALAKSLADRRIWAARHWAALPSPSTFGPAHALSARCLSLPLDGRYDADDMRRVADAVLALVRPGP
jgi:hypothetical protein